MPPGIAKNLDFQSSTTVVLPSWSQAVMPKNKSEQMYNNLACSVKVKMPVCDLCLKFYLQYLSFVYIIICVANYLP